MLQSTALFLVFTKEVSLLTIAVCLIALLLHSLFQLIAMAYIWQSENIYRQTLSVFRSKSVIIDKTAIILAVYSAIQHQAGIWRK